METMETATETEIWEIQVPGQVRVWVMDRRLGTYVSKPINGAPGKSPKRITLTRAEREYNQELVPSEKRQHDPFLNGSLVRIVDGEKQGDLTDEALMQYLELTTEETFQEAIEDIDIELTHRRLLSLAANHGRMWQVEALRTLVEERYPVPAAGTQRTVEEMFQDGEFGATRLS